MNKDAIRYSCGNASMDPVLTKDIVSPLTHFVSPVSQLATSMHKMSTTRCRQTPTRRLSLGGSNTPSSTKRSTTAVTSLQKSASLSHAAVELSPSVDAMESPCSPFDDVDDSPFLLERNLKLPSSRSCISRSSNSFGFHSSQLGRLPSSTGGKCHLFSDSLGCLEEEDLEAEMCTEAQQQQQQSNEQTADKMPDVKSPPVFALSSHSSSTKSSGRFRSDRVLSDGTNTAGRYQPCCRSLLSSIAGQISSAISTQPGSTSSSLRVDDNIVPPFTHPLVSKSLGSTVQARSTSSIRTSCSCDVKYMSNVSSEGLDTLLSSPIMDTRSGGDKTFSINKRSRRMILRSRMEDQENVDPELEKYSEILAAKMDRDNGFVAPAPKRCRNVPEEMSSCTVATAPLPMTMSTVARRPITRCMSETEVAIKSALNRAYTEPQELIGNFTKPYCLPLVYNSKHQDLKTISCHTLSRVLHNEFSSVIDKCVVVDCRYPYEYEGGHIENSVNIYTKDDIFSEFIVSTEFQAADDSAVMDRRLVVVFHCEFSSERGPRLMHFLRNKDREVHRDAYPTLHYPEMYLLDGGYKAFYESYSDQCAPRCYKPMLHDDHADDLRRFRAKSKSWAGERSGTATASGQRGMQLKPRSEQLRSCRRLQ